MMAGIIGLFFIIAAFIAVPALGRLLVACVLWAIVLSGIILVGAPILAAIVGISYL